jgi:hypothetical protein
MFLNIIFNISILKRRKHLKKKLNKKIKNMNEKSKTFK